ncbi:MAG: hypothetical protein WCJ25_02355 [Candidatus Moraniibacteriota bacterium]
MEESNVTKIRKSLEKIREVSGTRNLSEIVEKDWRPGLGSCFINLSGDNRDNRPVIALELCLMAMNDFPDLEFLKIEFVYGDRSFGIRFPAPLQEEIPEEYRNPAQMHMIR